MVCNSCVAHVYADAALLNICIKTIHAYVTHTYMHAYIHTHTHTYTHIHTHTDTYTHIHVHTHTHTSTYTHTLFLRRTYVRVHGKSVYPLTIPGLLSRIRSGVSTFFQQVLLLYGNKDELTSYSLELNLKLVLQKQILSTIK
jgi:hypothetical protein